MRFVLLRAALFDALIMTPRAIRRAAERKAKKLARRGEAHLAQIPASERPKSDEGNVKCCLNAVEEATVLSEPKIQARTGLTGRTILLPSEDAASYEQHVREFCDELQPVGPREAELVQSIADASWRLARIPRLEMTIYAYGRVEFAELFADQDAALRAGLIEMHTFLQYEKQLGNLQLQEGRLRRQREKDSAELSQLQKDRLATEPPQSQVSASGRNTLVGFEFSNRLIEEPQIETASSVAIAELCPKQSRDHTGAVRALSA